MTRGCRCRRCETSFGPGSAPSSVSQRRSCRRSPAGGTGTACMQPLLPPLTCSRCRRPRCCCRPAPPAPAGILAVCSLNEWVSPEIDISFLVGSFGASGAERSRGARQLASGHSFGRRRWPVPATRAPSPSSLSPLIRAPRLCSRARLWLPRVQDEPAPQLPGRPDAVRAGARSEPRLLAAALLAGCQASPSRRLPHPLNCSDPLPCPLLSRSASPFASLFTRPGSPAPWA